MQAAGVHWVRQEFHWNTLEPTSGTWNFSTYDFIVNAILSRGMQIIGLLRNIMFLHGMERLQINRHCQQIMQHGYQL